MEQSRGFESTKVAVPLMWLSQRAKNKHLKEQRRRERARELN